VVLSRELASRNHYPAVDVLNSVSRVMNDIVGQVHRDEAAKIRQILASLKSVEDLLSIGAYVRGSNPMVDDALKRSDLVNNFLIQGREEVSSFAETLQKLNGFLG
jgi:flagellum-specific ATP synthase